MLSECNKGDLPRITSIAVLDKQSSKMYNFSIHLAARQLNIKPSDILDNYKQIEEVMLERFFKFAEEKNEESIWIHWNMKNTDFGFEVLEHKYKLLTGETAFHIKEINKCDLSYLLIKKYGSSYSKEPKMFNLMMLNYKVKSKSFLSPKEEVEAYKTWEFVKLYNSTICKVYFLKYVFTMMNTNNLMTDSKKLIYKVEALTRNPVIKILVVISIILGIIGVSLILVILFLGISF